MRIRANAIPWAQNSRQEKKNGINFSKLICVSCRGELCVGGWRGERGLDWGDRVGKHSFNKR